MTQGLNEDQEMQELLAMYEQEKQAKQSADENKGQGGYTDFEHVECLGLEDQKEKAFRIVGRGFQNRKLPTDAKMIVQSSILNEDNKGYSKINWPVIFSDKKGDYIPDPDWILTRLYNKVREGKWKKFEDGHIDEKTKKDGAMNYFHKDTTVFKRTESNMRDNPSAKEFAPKFYPSKRIVINVIDRHDDWCTVNKHTKELSSKVGYSEKKNDNGETVKVAFPELGVPKLCYDSIINHYLKTSGSFTSIDTVIIKDTANKKYDIFDGMDERYLKPETMALLNCNPLTAEEKEFALYDFDNLYRVASYSKLKQKLGGLFKLCDIDLNTHFYDELVNLAKKEDEDKKANEKAKVESESVTTEEKTETPKPRETRQPVAESVPSKSIEELCIENFPSWGKVPDNEKTIMLNSVVSFNGSVPVYKKEAKDVLCNDASCHFKDSKEETTFPSTMFICPICGLDASK